jgi:hypothetical protein
VPAGVRPENAFGGGRSADVAHADEKNFHGHHIPAIQSIDTAINFRSKVEYPRRASACNRAVNGRTG